jgi:hypothetical protein
VPEAALRHPGCPEQLDEARARVPRAQHQLRPVLEEGGAALVSLSHLKQTGQSCWVPHYSATTSRRRLALGLRPAGGDWLSAEVSAGRLASVQIALRRLQ